LSKLINKSNKHIIGIAQRAGDTSRIQTSVSQMWMQVSCQMQVAATYFHMEKYPTVTVEKKIMLYSTETSH